MDASTRLAYATLAEATSADSLLCGNFRFPDSRDVVVVRGKQLVLYTLLSTSDKDLVPYDPHDAQSYSRYNIDDGKRVFGKQAVEESLRFVAETTLMDAPLSIHVLRDLIFHSYRRLPPKTTSESPVAGSSTVETSQSVEGNNTVEGNGSGKGNSTDKGAVESSQSVEDNTQDTNNGTLDGPSTSSTPNDTGHTKGYTTVENNGSGKGGSTVETSQSVEGNSTVEDNTQDTSQTTNNDTVDSPSSTPTNNGSPTNNDSPTNNGTTTKRKRRKTGKGGKRPNSANKDEINSTSALLLVFENGRLVVTGFNPLLNTFVTISLHVFDRRFDPRDDGMYDSLPLPEKQRITVIKQTHVSVCRVHKWLSVAHRVKGKQRWAIYIQRHMIALCHDERLIYLVPLVSEFKRPAGAEVYRADPFWERQENGIRPAETDHHSMITVPWMRVGNINEVNIDLKFGFCDERYFLRGLDFLSDDSMCILGLLMATKPETVGMHAMDGPDYTIGGMTYVAAAVNSRTRTFSVVDRVDKLPIDTISITGVPPHLQGGPSFVLTSSDFVIFTRLMSPVLNWQFVSPLGVLNTRFAAKPDVGYKNVFINAMKLNLDLKDYVLDTIGHWFILVPHSRGLVYMGKPACDHNGTLQDILWVKAGEIDFEVTAFQLTMIDGNVEFVATGSGFAIARFLVNVPYGFKEFDSRGRRVNLNVETSGQNGQPDVNNAIKEHSDSIDKNHVEQSDATKEHSDSIDKNHVEQSDATKEHSDVTGDTTEELQEVDIHEIPTTVCFDIPTLSKFLRGYLGEGSLEKLCSVSNHGAVRDSKNVTLPELWQVGCLRPTKGDETQSTKERIITKYKPQRRPWAVNDRQVVEMATLDYVWPKQQSIVGLSDDSKLVVLMEKYPLQNVISVPLQSGSRLVPLVNNGTDSVGTKMLVTWKGSTATVDVDEKLLDIKSKRTLDRRTQIQPEGAARTIEVTVETEEETLTYGTVLDNKYAVQVTATKAVFIDLVENKRVAETDLTKFDDFGSKVCVVEIVDTGLVCLFASGIALVLVVSESAGGPTLAITKKIGAGEIRHISLYRPRRLNNVFGKICLLVLTSKDVLFCYRMDNFMRIFALSGLTQVYPQLFNDKSAHLYIEEEGVPSVVGDTHAVGKRGRGSKQPTDSAEPKEKPFTKTTKSKVRKTVSGKEPRKSRTQAVDTVPVEGDITSALTSSSFKMPVPESIDATIGRWKKLRKYEPSFEYIISLRMLDVAPTDVGPTIVIMMTGRPLLIYRSYLLGCKEYVFELLYHKFVNPIPSALVNVQSQGSPKQRLFMRLKNERNVGNTCISEALVTHNNCGKLEISDVNCATVAFPHISPDDVIYYLVEQRSEMIPVAKPVAQERLMSNAELKSAVEVMQKRWNDFRPPCLRLSSVANRLYIHEYELENVLDMETVLGEAESRVVSLFSIVTQDDLYSRYVIFITQPGTLVLCVPGSLHQETNINGKISLQEIVAGSDEPEYVTTKRMPETTYNPLFCRLRSEDSHGLLAELSCGRVREHAGGLQFNTYFLSNMYHLGNLSARFVAVSHKNYYLSNGVIRANRNATIATLTAGRDIHAVQCGKLVAIVVRKPIPAKEELVKILNERIDLQLRQLETEQLPPGTKPIDIIEPNKQICTLIQTLDLLPQEADAVQPLWRDVVLVFHMGNLHWWFGEYEIEPMEAVLSMTFGIIGNKEYLLVGTCTNLGENVESKGDVVVIDLQSMFQRQPDHSEVFPCQNDSKVRRSPNCAVLNQYCKRIFPGPVTFLSSLNTDFDLIFRPNFKFNEDVANVGKSENVMIYGNEDGGRWTVTHFSPNFGLFVHSVGPRLFVHEVSGKQFLRGAFAEVPLCVSAACVFDKYVVACDINQGVHFFMYRHDAVNDSRTLSKIGATVKKVDLSVVACAPLVNSDALGLVVSDYFANLVLFRSESEPGGRETLVVAAALRPPTRVTHFLRREPDFRHVSVPSGVISFCADGSVLLVVMPESQPFQFFKTVQTTMESMMRLPLGVPRRDYPLFTSQMSQTQHVWPDEQSVLYLDTLRQLPFQSASTLSYLASRLSEDGGLLPYQLLNALYSSLLSL
ncbi:CPSF A subunit, putative [Babesia ovis]|uniref:CPSF A subunit, putative n=1 Tax=Babesia ovis TaxID=5869 RepID=A0A9W5WW17_BABOV|nr:CPSF A subunit, putative [Babesia ovis]